MNSSEITESSETTDSARVAEPEKMIFGEALLRAREAKAYSIIDVAKATHLAESIIDAIEQSDLTRLPPPTFVQGYLRTYARYLGLPEQKTVDDFNRAVPYRRESVLHPRHTLPSQASSHSPLIRGVSIVLIFLAILALVYGAYGYYVKTVKTIGLEKTSSQALRTSAAEVDTGEQHSVISEDGELIVVAPSGPGQGVEPEKNISIMSEPVVQAAVEKTPAAENMVAVVKTPAASNIASVKPESSVARTLDVSGEGADVLELQAFDDSWVEIVDASDRHLYHNLVQNEQVLRIKGDAPFDVFLGNAPGVELQVNNIEVNINRYIRTNNVARFSVSTRDGTVVFR